MAVIGLPYSLLGVLIPRTGGGGSIDFVVGGDFFTFSDSGTRFSIKEVHIWKG